MKKIFLLLISIFYLGCASEKYFYNGDKKIFISPIDKISRNVGNIDYYKVRSNGTQIGISNKILVKFVNETNLDRYISDFNLILKKNMGNRLYLFEVKNKSLTIDTANSLHKKSDVKFAEPDFIQKVIKR